MDAYGNGMAPCINILFLYLKYAEIRRIISYCLIVALKSF